MVFNDHSVLLHRDHYWLIMDSNHDFGLKTFPDLEISRLRNFSTSKFDFQLFQFQNFELQFSLMILLLLLLLLLLPTLVVLHWWCFTCFEPYLALRTCFIRTRLESLWNQHRLSVRQSQKFSYFPPLDFSDFLHQVSLQYI